MGRLKKGLYQWLFYIRLGFVLEAIMNDLLRRVRQVASVIESGFVLLHMEEQSDVCLLLFLFPHNYVLPKWFFVYNSVQS